MAIPLYGRPGRSESALLDAAYRQYRPDLTKTPEEQGFYHGHPCHLGHTLRDSKKHWCHDCAKRITSHVTGLDISFIHEEYRERAMAVMNMVKTLTDDDLDPGKCWDIGEDADARFNFPSYRSFTSKRRVDAVTIKKIVYQLFWGDIGKLYVTRDTQVCETPGCVNPLHLASTFNMATHRHSHSFHYLDLEPNPKKLMLMERSKVQGIPIDQVLTRIYKPTIRDPRMDKE